MEAPEKSVADIILDQIGVQMLRTMRARNIVKFENGVQFSIFPAHMKQGPRINRIRIELSPLDLYNVEFAYYRDLKYKVIETFDGIYNDQLPELIKSVIVADYKMAEGTK